MSSPADPRPTREIPATAAQPAPTPDAPPPAHFWRQKVPAHIGRARTSTLVIGLLFVALFGLYLVVRPPAVEYTTVETTSGETFRVPVTARVTPEPGQTPAPAPAPAPSSDVPAPSEPAETTAPAPTPPRSTSPGGGEDDGPATTTAPPRTSDRPPATSSAPDTPSGSERSPAPFQTSEETTAPEPTSSPTG